MALKVADQFAVDCSRYAFVAVLTTPKMGWVRPKREGEAARREQQVTAQENLPIWLVECLRMDTVEGTSELVTVQIAAAEAPAMTGPVHFQNLSIRAWTITDRETGALSNAGITLSAASIVAAKS